MAAPPWSPPPCGGRPVGNSPLRRRLTASLATVATRANAQSGRNRHAGKKRGKRPPASKAKKQHGRKPTPARGKAKAAPNRTLTSAAAGAVADRRTDVWGLVLIAVAILCGLGIYADLTGPAGHGIDTATGSVIGMGRWLLPLALVALGLALLRQERADEDGTDEPRGSAHLVVGSLIIGLAGTGLLHLGRGAPPIDGPVADLESAGGVIGAAIGQPLAALVATGGAVLVLDHRRPGRSRGSHPGPGRRRRRPHPHGDQAVGRAPAPRVRRVVLPRPGR